MLDFVIRIAVVVLLGLVYLSVMKGIKKLTQHRLEKKQEFVQKCKSKKLKPCRTIEERIARRKAAEIFALVPDIALKTWQEEIDHYQRTYQEELVV